MTAFTNLLRAVTMGLATTAAGTLCACGGGHSSAQVLPASVAPAPAPPALLRPPPAAGASAAVAVSIDLRRPGAPVPREFLGLSFEVSALPQIAPYGHGGAFANMLRSLGPGLLRFGGVSADTRTAWTDAVTPLPAWASSAVTAGELRDLRRLAERSGWHVLLTLGLAHYDPRAAAREARAAKTALGGWLAGIEVGNEADAYAHHHLRSMPWTVARYDREVTAYREAINRVAPGLALAGPDVSGSRAFETWGRGMAVAERPALLTGHHYPLGCRAVPPPTIHGLLSEAVRRAEGTSLRRYVSASRASGIRFRLDETNTVSCGGKAGISNTFASTLWAADYIARAMTAGAAGINLQGAPANCLGYSPVCVPAAGGSSGELIAQPEWYALLLSRGLVGDRPLPVKTSHRRANVDVFALLGARGQVHVVVIDDDPPSAKRAVIRLRLGGQFAGASILPLTAPAANATAGVSLGGRTVDSDGGWSAPPVLEQSPNRAGVVTLEVSPSSAMLVTVAPAR